MSVDVRNRVLVATGLLLLLSSTAVNVLQAKRIQDLLLVKSGSATQVGLKAVPIEGRTLTGESTQIAFDKRRPTLLYYFSTGCGWCGRNWANVQALHKAARGRYHLVAITSDYGVADYVRRHAVAVDVIEGIGENVRQTYGLYGTPHTLFIDSDGLVTHEWKGAFNTRISRDLESLFGVALPGLDRSEQGNN